MPGRPGTRSIRYRRSGLDLDRWRHPNVQGRPTWTAHSSQLFALGGSSRAERNDCATFPPHHRQNDSAEEGRGSLNIGHERGTNRSGHHVRRRASPPVPAPPRLDTEFGKSHKHCSVSFCVAFSQSQLPIQCWVSRLPRSQRCGITHFVGNEAFRETNRAEMVMRRLANRQVSPDHRCHRRREPTSIAVEIVDSQTRCPILTGKYQGEWAGKHPAELAEPDQVVAMSRFGVYGAGSRVTR